MRFPETRITTLAMALILTVPVPGRGGATVKGVNLEWLGGMLKSGYQKVQDGVERLKTSGHRKFKGEEVVLREIERSRKDPRRVESHLIPTLEFFYSPRNLDSLPDRILTHQAFDTSTRREILRLVGDDRLGRGENELARLYFQRLLELDIEDGQAASRLVSSMAEPAPAHMGVEAVHNRLPLVPTRALTRILLEEGRPTWAALYGEDLVRHRGAGADDWTLLGDAYRESGRLDRAEYAYNRSFTLLDSQETARQ